MFLPKKRREKKSLFLSFLPAALGVFFILAGCGIPDYPYLEPPTANNPGDYSTGKASFQNAYFNNDSIFTGYIFYYRLFNTEAELNSAVSNLTSATTPGTNQLTQQGYRRLPNSAGADPVPLLPIPQANRNTPFTIEMNFLPLDPDDPAFATLSWFGGGVGLGRNIQQNRLDPQNVSYKVRGFKPSDFYKKDGDIPGTFPGSGNENEIWLSVYVLSFGMSNANPVYSQPVQLGRFLLEVNTTGLNDD